MRIIPAALLLVAAAACTTSTTKSVETVDAATPGPDQLAGAACDPSLENPCRKGRDGCTIYFCDTASRTCSRKPSGVCAQACEPAPDGSCPTGCNWVTGSLVSFDRDCVAPVQVHLACSNAQGGTGAVICEVNTATNEVYAIGTGPLWSASFPDWRYCTDAERAAYDQARMQVCSPDAGSLADAAHD